MRVRSRQSGTFTKVGFPASQFLQVKTCDHDDHIRRMIMKMMVMTILVKIMMMMITGPMFAIMVSNGWSVQCIDPRLVV